MANVARNMLVLETILELNWYATYARMPVLSTVRYLYYDYNTGRFDGSPATDTLLAATPPFQKVTQTTLWD